MNAIFNRASVRVFKDAPVEKEKIEMLLKAAMQAPSAGNQQPWEFIVVEDKKTLEQLSETDAYAKFVAKVPDNMAAGPASYGMTDTMGRMHSDAQFAGSSSVPAHVEMMGLIGMGNNPMVGATVSVAVAIEEAMN